MEPPAISRLVDFLTDVIKPAAPNSEIRDLINGNAKNWAHTTILILQKHYADMLDFELDKLVTKTPTDWHEQFEIAVKWAHRNRGKRLKQETIKKAEELISAYFGALPDKTQEPPDSEPEPSHSKRDEPTCQGTVASDQEVRAILQTLPVSTKPVPQTPLVSTIAIQTDGAYHEWSPPGGSSTPFTVNFDLVTLDEDDNLDTSTHNTQDLPQQTLPLPPRSPRQQTRQLSLLDMDLDLSTTTKRVTTGNPSSNTATATNLSPVVPLTPLPARRQTALDSAVLQPQNLMDSPKDHRVIKHPHTNRKLKSWDLSIRKKTLIMGDSNVARIGTFSQEDVQIDSYPGANFLHAESLLKKARAHCAVNNIILSFGINSRSAKIKETVTKQIQRALKAARDKFPFARVLIPMINFSTALPHKEQTTLDNINRHIERNCQFIPLLPRTQFHTERDLIHWTKETSQNMLKHWCEHLN